MKLMMDRLHIKSDDAFVKFKQKAMNDMKKELSATPTSKQVLFLSDFSDFDS